ncbi:dienelactone hydrolase family protein, partial [Mesorhizobium sp.]|uniref:dienelactone hydrolase family protein n=1 Tax=Mesorhizobium sp. TaxID=1871066 RepID=UPI0025F9166C
ANSAQAAVVADNDPRVKGEDISYPGSSGEMKGYLVKPADKAGKLGTVNVVHENRGLNPHIRDVTRRVALEGFVALAPDFLSPLGGTPTDEDKARDMFAKLDPAQTIANGVATVAFLKSDKDGNGKVGAIGFCWGGGTVNMLAINAPDLSAGVAYYGMQPKAADVSRIKAALLLHYGGLDERINAGIDAFKKELDAAHVEYTVYVYEGANHAFNNDTSAARYDKKAADLAWGRTIAFLKQKLA